MRKSLLLVALFTVSIISAVKAQGLFEAPDTVCVRQPIQLKSLVPDKQSHYWGFCSAYLPNLPTGTNLGDGFSFDEPSAIEMAKNSDGNYYAFVANIGTNTNTTELLRLDYGESLENVPVVTSFGDMDGILPVDINSMYLLMNPDDSNWHMFITGGTIPNTSSLARLDFGKSLGNTPNIVNFGNLGGKMNYPTGIFVAKSDVSNKWFGFYMNRPTGEMKRLDMDTVLSLTPSITDSIVISGLADPTDLGALKHKGAWYFYVTNAGSNNVVRIDMGSLSNTSPTVTDISGGISNLNFDRPSAISLIKDCDRIYAFVANGASHDVFRISMESPEGPYTGSNFSNLGGTLAPAGLTRVIRDRDNVYMYVLNRADNSLTEVKFEQCNNVNIQYSLTNQPPPYSYSEKGYYNVYYAVNEGMPDMDVECQQIYAAEIPAMIITPDTTICEGDTAVLEVVSINAISFTWSPNYNITSANGSLVKVAPRYSVNYRVRMPFPIGSCVVDTGIQVDVIKVNADAGPDRTIADGASTMIGGPLTITNEGDNYLYKWEPRQYIDDVYSLNPTVRPPQDFTYYLTVTDTTQPQMCSSVDTVIVYVDCGGVNLPNAFMPERGGAISSFGLLNSQIVQLSKFNIFDRWGNLVFTTTDPTKEWDGTFNGEKAAVGVYVYEVDGFCNTGKRIQKTGNVTLIR